MAKSNKHKLLLPPRYRRGDPRNLERMRLGGNLGRMNRQFNKNAKPAAGVKGEEAGTDDFGVT